MYVKFNEPTELTIFIDTTELTIFIDPTELTIFIDPTELTIYIVFCIKFYSRITASQKLVGLLFDLSVFSFRLLSGSFSRF